MNTHFLKLILLGTASTIFTVGCSSDNTSFETPNTTTAVNNAPVSQKNFTILFSPVNVAYQDLVNGGFTAQEADISVQIGDNNNQLITGERTIYFRTEWGLIEPSCKTDNGSCSVKWRSGSPDDRPSNLRNNIVAYSPNGQESFTDTNGNGLFDDTDTFEDLDEPYIDINENGIFDTGDIIIDTINGTDLTGTDTVHNIVDGLYNGPNCAHTSLCSTVLTTSTVWENGSIGLTTDTFTVGGTINGLTGTVILQNLGGDDLTITADGAFTFDRALFPFSSYLVTVSTQPAGQTCTITTGTESGTANNNVTTVAITCA